jgi:hypothetical protein
VREDRREFPVAEAAGVRGGPQRLVDIAWAVQLGQIDRLGDLAPQACRPGRRGRDQPLLSAAGPIARNARSSAPRARGLRSSAPAGLGG